MSVAALLQYVVFLGIVTALVKPAGDYLLKVFNRNATPLDWVMKPIERFVFWVIHIDPETEMSWSRYLTCFILFTLAGTLVLYAALRLQAFLPGGPPAEMLSTPMAPDLALNTAVSFTTTTTWQAYAGLVTPVAVLISTALAVVLSGGLAGLTTNTGPHGFSEILYAYTSCCANNGQAMAGLNANTLFYNLSTIPVMLAGRFAMAIPALALAGRFASQGRRSQHVGTLPADSPMVAAMAIFTAALVVLLSFLPALVMGPLIEHILLHS